MESNRTREKAYIRVLNARTNSLAGELTLEYLEKLLEELEEWTVSVRETYREMMNK